MLAIRAIASAAIATPAPSTASGLRLRHKINPLTLISIKPAQVRTLARRRGPGCAGLKSVPTGIAHGTVTAVAERTPFEITTLRRDVSTDGRNATVAFTDDWAEDAARRDFRLNALYADAEGRFHAVYLTPLVIAFLAIHLPTLLLTDLPRSVLLVTDRYPPHPGGLARASQRRADSGAHVEQIGIGLAQVVFQDASIGVAGLGFDGVGDFLLPRLRKQADDAPARFGAHIVGLLSRDEQRRPHARTHHEIQEVVAARRQDRHADESDQ